MLILLNVLLLAGITKGFFTITPNDTLAVLGSTTQLNCSYYVSGKAKWLKGEGNDKTTITDGNDLLGNDGKYDIVGDEDHIEYNLRIFDVDRTDEDNHECGDQISDGQRASAYLYVIHSVPNCSVEPNNILKAGENATLICIIDLKENAPGELVWYRNGSEIHKTEGHESTLTIKMDKSDNKAAYSCQLQHFTLPSWKWSDLTCQDNIIMDVQYAPDISIVNYSHNQLREGSDFIAECYVINANPEKIDDEYWVSPHGERLSDNSSLSLVNVTRELSGQYTCVMSNVFYDGEIGNGSSTIEVEVQYLSTVKMETISPSINITEGDEVTLQCQAEDGNPDPHKLELLFGGNVIEKSDTRVLRYTIDNIEGSQSGIYQCNAYTLFYSGEENSSNTKEIIVIFSPKIVFEETRFEASIGDTVPMPCKVRGFPTPSVSWLDDKDSLIPGDEENKKITEEITEEEIIVTNTLTVTVADESYYGIYTCKATNKIEPDGEQTTEIIKPSDSGSNSMIIAITVTVTSVVIVVIVIAIIYCCRRTAKKGNVNRENRNTGRVADGDKAELAPNYGNDRQEPDGGSQEIALSPYGESTASSDGKPSSLSPDGAQEEKKEGGLHPNLSALYSLPHKEKKTTRSEDSLDGTRSDSKANERDQPPAQDITGMYAVSQKQSRTSKKDRDPKGDLAYADLDLTGSSGPGQQRQKKPPETEKTQYASIMHTSSNP